MKVAEVARKIVVLYCLYFYNTSIAPLFFPGVATFFILLNFIKIFLNLLQLDI